MIPALERVSLFQGQPWLFNHCNISRWPPQAANRPPHKSTHPKDNLGREALLRPPGGLFERPHNRHYHSTDNLAHKPTATVWGASASCQGARHITPRQPWERRYCKTTRWPPRAAVAQVSAFQFQISLPVSYIRWMRYRMSAYWACSGKQSN